MILFMETENIVGSKQGVSCRWKVKSLEEFRLNILGVKEFAVEESKKIRKKSIINSKILKITI